MKDQSLDLNLLNIIWRINDLLREPMHYFHMDDPEGPKSLPETVLECLKGSYSRFERAFVKYPVKNPRYYITAVLMILWESRSIFKSILFRDPLKDPHQDLGLKLLEKIYFEESKTIFVVEFIKNPSKNSMKYLKEGFSKIC